MKKLVIATALAALALSSHAVEVGITTTADYSPVSKETAAGFTISDKIGKSTVTAGFQRFNEVDRYTVTVGHDVAKFGPVTVAAKAGVAVLNNKDSSDGSAIVVGATATMPLTKTVALTVDADRQYGQDRVKVSDGNRVTVGLKYGF